MKKKKVSKETKEVKVECKHKYRKVLNRITTCLDCKEVIDG